MSKYISLENLERYDSKMQERAASFCASKEDGMWRQTEKAGAVAFWPVGNSPLEGTVEFMFKETPPASGDKSPTNPSTISGVSSIKVTRCGKNLIPIFTNPYTTQGITFTPQADGGFKISGTTNGTAHAYYDVLYPFVPKNGVQYAVSISSTSSQSGITIVGRTSSNENFFSVSLNEPYSFTGDGTILRVRLAVNRTAGTVDLVVYPQIELSTVATTFEPYSGTDSTINLGGTFYGGSIDLATGLMMVTDISWVLDEGFSVTMEAYNSTTGYAHFNKASFPNGAPYNHFPNNANVDGYYSCTHFPTISTSSYQSVENGTITYPNIWFVPGGNQLRIVAPFSSDTNFRTWLGEQKTSGTPVILVYRLLTPITLQLTPTSISALAQPDKYVPRVNTVYTDADAVQIVYQKNPVRDKFEKVQAIIAQGGNV